MAPLVDDPRAQPRQLTHGLGAQRGAVVWSPDSRTLAAQLVSKGRDNIELIDVATGTFAPLQTPNLGGLTVCCPAFSLDGRWISAWVEGGARRQQYRFSIGPVPLAEPVPGLMNPDAYFEDLEWSYFVGKDGSGFFRQHFATPPNPNPQPEAIPGLADVIPGDGWQVLNHGILFIDFNAAVRTLKRWDAKTGKIEDLTGPLPRVDPSQDFSYNREKHFLVYPQFRDNAGSQILGLRIPR